MIIFDSKQVTEYAAVVNAQFDRCEREGMLCSNLDSSLSCCADLCCKFANQVQRWARDVFHGRVAFDATAEQFWKAELMRIYERAHALWSEGRSHEDSCFVLDGLKKLQSSLFGTDIACDSPAFAEILRWKFEEPFVQRLLIDDIPQRILFGGCRMICYSNPEREIVGFGTIQRSGEFAALTEGRDHPYIPLLGVDPAKRGKGYGRQIVEHLILLAWHM